jgi:hypothetical protein
MHKEFQLAAIDFETPTESKPARATSQKSKCHISSNRSLGKMVQYHVYLYGRRQGHPGQPTPTAA